MVTAEVCHTLILCHPPSANCLSGFVEGGDGTTGEGVLPEGDVGPGNTYCAPKTMDSNCALEPPQREEMIRSEQDWQAQAHRLAGGRLRTLARDEAGRTPQQLGHTAVFISVMFFNDPTSNPAGYMIGNNDGSGDVAVAKRGLGYTAHLSPIERLQFMSNLTWKQVRNWEGEHVAVQLNNTILSSDATTRSVR